MNKSIAVRLLEKRYIDPITNCWLWTGAKFGNGYGSIKYKGESESVHRLSLIVFKNIIFEIDEQANHTRECPYKHCFNPDHLYKGTQSENMADYGSKCKKCGGSKLVGVKCYSCKAKYNREYYRSKNKHRKNFGRE